MVEIPFYVAKPNISGIMSMYDESLFITIVAIIGIIFCIGSMIVVRILENNFKCSYQNAHNIYLMCVHGLVMCIIFLFIGLRTVLLLRK